MKRAAVLALFSAAAVLIVFIAAALLVRGAIERNVAFQSNLRSAQTSRARLLRLQVDEEAGVRGYVATRAPIFLEPYATAVRAFGPTLAELDRSVAALSVDEAPVRIESAINRQWLHGVGEPLARNPAGSTLKLQLFGKSLVDRFRSQDVLLNQALNATADVAERQTANLVGTTLIASIAIGFTLAAIFGWLSIVQGRLAAELEEQRRAYFEEKRIADALQEAFLQTELPHVPKADLHAVYVPAGGAARVGGDWYDAFELSEGRILFSIGDVAGHGIGAAVVMSRVRQAMLSVGLEENDPAAILARVNEILLMQDRTIVTTICGFLDLAHGLVRLANAGHPAAIFTHPDGKIERLGATGPPLGTVDRPVYSTQSIVADAGSMLALYTDGLIEYSRDFELGERRLSEALRDVGGAADPAAALMQGIFDGEAPVDDVAILTIRFREPDPTSLDDPSRAAAAVQPLWARRSMRSLLASALPLQSIGERA
jgi:hypothetical protein